MSFCHISQLGPLVDIHLHVNDVHQKGPKLHFIRPGYQAACKHSFPPQKHKASHCVFCGGIPQNCAFPFWFPLLTVIRLPTPMTKVEKGPWEGTSWSFFQATEPLLAFYFYFFLTHAGSASKNWGPFSGGVVVYRATQRSHLSFSVPYLKTSPRPFRLKPWAIFGLACSSLGSSTPGKRSRSPRSYVCQGLPQVQRGVLRMVPQNESPGPQ